MARQMSTRILPRGFSCSAVFRLLLICSVVWRIHFLVVKGKCKDQFGRLKNLNQPA